MSIEGKPIETESRSVICKGRGVEEWGLTANGDGVSFRDDEI